jgi:hypothetical protein
VIPQEKYNQLSRNRSSKVIDVLKLNRTLQNVPYYHVIIVINHNTNNIHILYQSAISFLQDEPFFFYVEFVKTAENFRNPNPTPSCATGCTSHKNYHMQTLVSAV